MIRHIFKLIWIQRKQNIWIFAELSVVFILLWYIMDYFLVLGYNASTDNGYEIKDTYQIQLTVIPSSCKEYTDFSENKNEITRNYLSLLDRISKYPVIEKICVTNMCAPYTGSYKDIGLGKDSMQIEYYHLFEVTPSYFEVFRIYSQNDKHSQLQNLLTENNIILSRKLYTRLFQSTNSKESYLYNFNQERTNKLKVAGITTSFKTHNYSREECAVFKLLSNSDIAALDENELADLEISIRVKPGINKNNFISRFEDDMSEQLSIGNFIVYKVQSYEDISKIYFIFSGITDTIRSHMGFMIFLLANIFLGILGTFWLRNEYRQAEIGLRLVVGSTRKEILYIMMGEGLCLLVFAAIPAIIVIINLTLSGLMNTEFMDASMLRLSTGILFTFLFLTFLILLATYYPAYLSSRITPADTLRSE